MAFLVTKYSGEQEPFNVEKFTRSLKKAGADDELISALVQEVTTRTDLATTHDIYQFAFAQLEKKNRPVAARYSIKKALTELGPTGFPFEEFIARLFRHLGYETKTDLIIKGQCVDHEVDVVALHKEHHYMIECKFHAQGLKCDVKIPLYIQARFEDIDKAWHKNPKNDHKFQQAWIVTNTKFTTQAVEYAACVNINLLGWSYPLHDNLPELIDRFDLYPITTLTTLNSFQKQQLVENGIMLCRDIIKKQQVLKNLHFSDTEIREILQEAQGVCLLKQTP